KLGMAARPPDSLERLTQTDLIGVVRELIGEVGRLRAENEKLSSAFTELKTEHQAVKDELARLKNLPPRPPQKPSGMDKATDRSVSGGGGAKNPEGKKSGRRRGSQLDKLTIGATVVVGAKVPPGSRHKGYEEIVVQDLSLSPQVTRYRRERWQTPEGKTIIAALDPGIVGGYGPNLHRFVLALHFSGQVTCERIVALLNGMGVMISKRQVVRLLTVKLETFRAEDEAVLNAGLHGAYVTVDDTGAAYFGYPQAHEDDPERAVRAGLALIEAVRLLGSPDPLQVRIGVATGLVVVGDLVDQRDVRERSVVGETPNLAARLQSL